MLTLGDLKKLDLPDGTLIVVDQPSLYNGADETSDVEIIVTQAVDQGHGLWDTRPSETTRGHRQQVIKLQGNW